MTIEKNEKRNLVNARNLRKELAKYIADYINYSEHDKACGCSTHPGEIETAIEAFEGGSSDSGDHFKVEISQEEPENVPCVSCGDKSKPLHTNFRCTDCFVKNPTNII